MCGVVVCESSLPLGYAGSVVIAASRALLAAFGRGPPPCRYTSKVTLHCPTAVHSRVEDSTLFSHLTNKWEFR